MKKIIIGTLVAAVIFFAFEAIMWEGGFNNDFAKHTPGQDAILEGLSTNLNEDGLYYIPSADPSVEMSTDEHHQYMEDKEGKPWAMIFYHQSFNPETPSMMIMGFLHDFIACLIVCLILFHGSFPTMGKRFLVSMGIGIFALVIIGMNQMNWWSFPWSWVKPLVVDMIIGWGIVSIWLAWYMKPKATT